MDKQERELREDRTGRSVRAALRAERAPRAWALAALAAPARTGVSARARVSTRAAAAALPREESRFLVVLPHLLGVSLLLGFGLSALLRPDLLSALDAAMRPLLVGGARGAKDVDVARLVPWLAIAAPLLVLVLLDVTRGFAFVRRWFS